MQLYSTKGRSKHITIWPILMVTHMPIAQVTPPRSAQDDWRLSPEVVLEQRSIFHARDDAIVLSAIINTACGRRSAHVLHRITHFIFAYPLDLCTVGTTTSTWLPSTLPLSKSPVHAPGAGQVRWSLPWSCRTAQICRKYAKHCRISW